MGLFASNGFVTTYPVRSHVTRVTPGGGARAIGSARAVASSLARVVAGAPAPSRASANADIVSIERSSGSARRPAVRRARVRRRARRGAGEVVEFDVRAVDGATGSRARRRASRPRDGGGQKSKRTHQRRDRRHRRAFIASASPRRGRAAFRACCYGFCAGASRARPRDGKQKIRVDEHGLQCFLVYVCMCSSRRRGAVERRVERFVTGAVDGAERFWRKRPRGDATRRARPTARGGARRRATTRRARARTMANDPYEPDDASDSDEDARARRAKDARERFERDVEDELGDATDVDERSWEGFWRRATAENAAKMRRAGLDPNKAESKVKFGRHGEKLDKGKCATTLCFGCDARCDETFECAQCLEIYRARAKKVAFDAWERAFFCSCECYIANWDEHRRRHGPSTAGPTKMDGAVHEFEAPPGLGALWHGSDLRRLEFEECAPMMY